MNTAKTKMQTATDKDIDNAIGFGVQLFRDGRWIDHSGWGTAERALEIAGPWAEQARVTLAVLQSNGRAVIKLL